MKKVYLVLLLNSLFINLQAQNFEWAKREGKYAYDYGYGITNDNAGNVYVTGKYEEMSNFSGTILRDMGNHDIFLAQYSPAGNLNWVTTAGGISGDYGTAVSCDGDNFIYIAGEIEGWGDTAYFENSPVTLFAEGSNDIFLAKYDLSGNLIWAERAGGIDYEKALGVTHDQYGNVYICGFYRGHATFGGNTTIYNSGNNDIFIAKYDADGNFIWVKKAGGSGRDEAKFIKCDPAGNVYVCGMYSDGCNFSGQTLASPNGFFNTFLAKYAPDGTLKWIKTTGGDYDDVAWGLTMDNAGKIYIGGEFNDALTFAGAQLSTTGSADVFVACYDSLGTELWAKKAGGTCIDRARGIGSDGTKIYITGQFCKSASFGTHTVTAADSSDIFMAALNNTGNFIWATSVGGVADSLEDLGYESGNTICADASGNVYASGALLDGGTFGNTSVNEYGRTDVFVTKITQGPDVIAPLAVTLSPADNSLNVPINSNLVITFNETVQKGAGNILIKESGVITQTIPVAGTNVTISNNVVTINPADFTNGASVNIEIAAGVFKDMTNNNYAGINNNADWNFTTSAAIRTIVNSFSPADNMINVPINSDIIIVFNMPIQKGTGNIIIKEAGVVSQTIAVTGSDVTISGNTVTINTADFTMGALVNVEMAAGVFKDTMNNDYAGINDATTWNFSIGSKAISVAEMNATPQIDIYPNPVKNNLNIDLSRVGDQKMEIVIFNCLGGIMERRINISPSKINIDLSALKNGIYFITINGEHTQFNQKIVIQ